MFTRDFCSFCLHLLTAITLFLGQHQHAQTRSFRVRVLQMHSVVCGLENTCSACSCLHFFVPCDFSVEARKTSSPCFRFFVRLHRRRGSAASATFPAPQEQMCCSELARLLICTPRKAGSRGGEGGRMATKRAFEPDMCHTVTQPRQDDMNASCFVPPCT